jgi:hypothetical protein
MKNTGRNTEKRMQHKHFRLDAVKVKLAQQALGSRTETETIDLALDRVIAEHERHRLTQEANERFLRSGAKIKDIYGKESA